MTCSGLVVNEAIKSGFQVRNQGATSAEIAAASWSGEGPETEERDKKREWVERPDGIFSE
jgi:hypothetical protein